jgi:DNA-binding MarR family transcriptional regulator
MSVTFMPRAIRQHHVQASRVQVLAINDAYLCFAVQSTARRLAQYFDRVLDPLDLTNGQFSMLNFIVGLDKISVGELGRKLAMEHSTVSIALKTLSRRGLIATLPDKADKRQRLVSATAKGRTLLSAALPVWHQHHHALLAGMGPEVMKALLLNLPQVKVE